MLYALQTLPGMAELAWGEAETQLPQERDQPGPRRVGQHLIPGRNDMITLDYRGGPGALLRLRLAEDVFVVAARAFRVAPDERGLRQIHAAVSNSPSVGDALAAWRRATKSREQSLTYRVIARTVGRHRFLRRDVGRAVSDAIRDGWTGRWARVEEDADVEVWATLIESELLVALRLSGAEMRQRGKLHHIPASLRPALAAAMVMLTEPAPDDVFLDPMAGAGTILFERAAAGPFDSIHGGDTDPAAVTAMRANLRGVGGTIYTSRWDARRLPLEDASVDKVAVNLPFGRQIGSEADLPGLYRATLAEILRVLRPGGRLVTLTSEIAVLETARQAVARPLRPIARHRVAVQGRPATIGVYVRQ